MRLVPVSLLLLIVITPFSIGGRMSRGAGASETIPGKVALVIGNGNYKMAPLQNPVNDAHDMAAALRQLGFDVVYGEDLSQDGMTRTIKEFRDKLASGSIGLFYYAGHGSQIDGRNYLIPVDATVASAQEVIAKSVEVNSVLGQMESARNRVNLIILDACRNNPFVGKRTVAAGLASIKGASGTLIAYATAPDSVARDGEGRNGLYTSELLNAIRLPGVRIEDVFMRVRVAVEAKSNGDQVPWESSSLVSLFYFTDPKPEQAAPTALKSVTQVDRTNALETARACLQAYRARDIIALSEFTVPRSRQFWLELVRDGERHPRYRSIWVTWRWQRAQAWDGRMDDVRYRKVGTSVEAHAKFAESDETYNGAKPGGEAFVVTLRWEDGKWWFEDINAPSRASLEAESKVKPE
ncbi:MAG TPA: caspase domain-containing protein [Pyrinomonadaceae bacterium]|jgi:caspase domain-containing protein|nr:caspase domain-containing protein [Pyrinomonadaceae bacterium]